MIDLHASFDAEAWRWTLATGTTIGPAGVASAAFTNDIRLEVDAWTGTLLAIIIDAEDQRGATAPRTSSVLRQLVGQLPIDGASTETIGSAEVTLSRLARVTEAGMRRSTFGMPVDEYQKESAFLRAAFTRPGRNLEDQSALSPPTEHTDRVRSALERVRTRPHDLGSLSVLDSAGSATRRVAVDPSNIPPGIAHIADGIGVRRRNGMLDVDIPIASHIYAVEVQRLSLVIIDEHSDTPVALSRVELGSDANGNPAGVAELALATNRPADRLSLVLTDDPQRVPSRDLRCARAATNLADAAATTYRLGDVAGATQLIERSLDRWSGAGRRFEAPGTPPGERPFWGDFSE